MKLRLQKDHPILLDRRKIVNIFNPIIAIVIASVISGLVVSISGGEPLEAYSALAKGAFGSVTGIKNTIRYTLPILLLALSFSICDRCGYFNIGQEGQMYCAVLTIAWIQNLFSNLPTGILIVLMVIGAMLSAGIISLIPALLKFLLGINEVVIALLLNNIIILLAEYMLLYSPIASSGTSVPMSIDIVPTFSNIFMIATVVLIIVVYSLVMKNTVPGYRLRMVGHNSAFAKASGIKTIRTVLIVAMVGGALAGITAVGEILGVYHRMYKVYADGMGFSAMTAALIGKHTPFGMVLGSLILGALQSGSITLPVATDTPAEMVLVVKGFVMLFTTVNLLQYLIRNKKENRGR